MCWRQAPHTLPAEDRLQAIRRYATQGLRHMMRWEAAAQEGGYLALALNVISVMGHARTVAEMLEATLGHILDGLGHEAGAMTSSGRIRRN